MASYTGIFKSLRVEEKALMGRLKYSPPLMTAVLETFEEGPKEVIIPRQLQDQVRALFHKSGPPAVVSVLVVSYGLVESLTQIGGNRPNEVTLQGPVSK